MNDCLIGFLIECEISCGDCKHYISVNGTKGNELLEEYQEEIEKAIKPVKEKWIAKLTGGKYDNI